MVKHFIGANSFNFQIMHLGIISLLTLAMIVLSIVGYVQTSDCTRNQYLRLLDRNSNCLKQKKREIKNKSTKEKKDVTCNRSLAEEMFGICYKTTYKCIGTCCFRPEEINLSLSMQVDNLMESCELNRYKDKIGTGACSQYELDRVDQQVKQCEKDKIASFKASNWQFHYFCSR